MLSRARKCAPEDVSQGLLILDREAAQNLGGLAHASAHLVAQLLTVAGQHDVLNAPILLVGTALHESPLLEPVDDARHVRAVAAQQRRELAHRERSARLHLQQRALLRWMEPQLCRDIEIALALRNEKAIQQRPGLVGGLASSSLLKHRPYILHDVLDS
jgi:hypothetical protein